MKKRFYFVMLMTIVLFGLPNVVSANETGSQETVVEDTIVGEDEVNVLTEEVVEEETDILTEEVVEEETVYVAQIGEVSYETLDGAIEAAVSGDTIVLLGDATTEGINLTKDLYIESEEGSKYTITFTTNGIAMWGKALSFKNVNVVMTSIGSTPYTAEWNWMTICGNNGSNLLLDNVNMTLDGINTSNKHAIYFTGNNKFEVKNGSVVTIKNYTQDAVEWDGGDASTYSFIVENSTYVSDNNRSGITGTFTAKFDNAKVDVINSTGNGSNGTHFEIINESVVNFNDNKAHGLSAGRLIIDNSVVNANNNGANGIHTNTVLTIRNNSVVTVTGNDCSISSKWTFPGAIHVGGKELSTIASDTTLTIMNNNGSGIFVKSGANLTIEAGIITNNKAVKTGLGGGIYNAGTIVVSENVDVYNNNADTAGDDIYNVEGATITLPATGEDWELDGGEKHDGLEDCTDSINGWYDDKDDTRWEAHGETEEDDYYVEVEPVSESQDELKLKAAHDKTKVIVHYVNIEGESLAEDVVLIGISGEEYITEEKEFADYVLVQVEGEVTGLYEKETIEVTYIYSNEVGEEVPPHTGVEEVNISYNYNDVLYSDKKKNNKKINF